VVSLVDLVRVFQQVLERAEGSWSRIELRHEEFTVAQMIAADPGADSGEAGTMR